jgi:catalase
MTTAAGAPVGNNQNSLTFGLRSPVLTQDSLLVKKMAHFNRGVYPNVLFTQKGQVGIGHLK